VTERKQLILIPESSEMRLGEDAFRKIIKQSKLSKNQAIVDKVKKVGNRIAKASNHVLFFGLIRPNFSDYSDPFELA